jgi:ribosomal protein S21
MAVCEHWIILFSSDTLLHLCKMNQRGTRIVSLLVRAGDLVFPLGATSLQQHRGIISVDVHGNKVDRALRMLRRKLIDEGVRETWMKQRVFVKPTHERKRVLEEAERRNKNRGFKEKMRWILRRKARGY